MTSTLQAHPGKLILCQRAVILQLVFLWGVCCSRAHEPAYDTAKGSVIITIEAHAISEWHFVSSIPSGAPCNLAGALACAGIHLREAQSNGQQQADAVPCCGLEQGSIQGNLTDLRTC